MSQPDKSTWNRFDREPGTVIPIETLRAAATENFFSTPAKRKHEDSTKREIKYETKDWKWLLWKSDMAHEKIHPELGAVWMAVLMEACCVREGVDKDKVQRLRKDVKEPLRLWPKKALFGDRNDFKDMVVTVPLLEWCVKRKYKPDAWTFEVTARGGDMDAIRWLWEHKCPWHQEYGGNACTGAARGGHLDVLKWLREEGCPWDEGTCYHAAKAGHLDVLKYAHENGCPWDKRTCSSAALGGHMDVLKYLHANGCPWDGDTCYYAAAGGHLGVLKYARKNGCPWNEGTCSNAAAGGHLDVLKYLHENGCS